MIYYFGVGEVIIYFEYVVKQRVNYFSGYLGWNGFNFQRIFEGMRGLEWLVDSI